MEPIEVAKQVSIPVVDISGYLSGDPIAKNRVAKEIRNAYENQGFLQVVGHRVSSDIQNRYLAAITEFFALPLSEKEKVAQSKSKCNRGYERIGGQKLDELDEDATPDQKEGFSIRQERPLGRFLEGPNQWPETLPHLKDIFMEYFDAVHQLSKTMFRLIALSLGLAEDHFDYFASDPNGICLCRAHHYPPSPKDSDSRTRGVGAHTDFGALTLLLQDTVGGLEVLHKPTSTWHAVTPIQGAFVVNIGDLMQIWTNNRYKSTMHRVISPLSDKDRYSSAFFNDGALDLIVECIPTCLKSGEKPMYSPVRVEDHCIKRYLQSYGAGGTKITV
ncbi:putative gibberellin 20 oxidase [Coleophoma crateriformis]|uniref:Putative gibberellin 20 oxidase n=1 Tax=Coleophoma crateriformis TaxID=565419 RepID=A0A3D8RED7_9HELO|nr:putative gibberellin 20 oxidase [Coleophoma crateriformis]